MQLFALNHTITQLQLYLTSVDHTSCHSSGWAVCLWTALSSSPGVTVVSVKAPAEQKKADDEHNVHRQSVLPDFSSPDLSIDHITVWRAQNRQQKPFVCTHKCLHTMKFNSQSLSKHKTVLQAGLMALVHLDHNTATVYLFKFFLLTQCSPSLFSCFVS